MRELFKDKPTLEQLVASGEPSGHTVPMGLYLEIQMAECTGMDKAVLLKMENGQHGIPTLPSLARYAQAVGLRLAFSLTPGTEAKSMKE